MAAATSDVTSNLTDFHGCCLVELFVSQPSSTTELASVIINLLIQEVKKYLFKLERDETYNNGNKVDH